MRIKPIVYAIGVLLASACLGIPATFSVYTNADVGAGSLRQAILDANTSADGDTITFDLPLNGRTIVVQNPLPKVTNTLVIDASSQTDVKLVGPGNYIGFEISATSVTIRGITIQNFEQGVRIGGGASNRIEGCSITGHSLFGVALDGGSYHEIVNNVISSNRIGISDSFGSRGTNYIRGNLIGTDASGTNSLGNADYGILGSGYSYLVIGGRESSQGNVISGNGTGIHLKLFGQIPSVIQGNSIGTDRSGTLNLSNTWNGISLILGPNQVGGVEPGAANTIAFNGRTGVAADSATFIQGNRIFNNGLLGIDAANTNSPSLTHALTSPGSTLIVGSVIGTPMTIYRIEFFNSDACDPSGFGEGQRFIGFTSAVTDNTGRGPFALTLYATLPVPSVVTATATSPQGGTSRFSACQPVISPESVDLSVRQTDRPDPAEILSNITYTVTISNAGPSRATNVVLENVLPDAAELRSVQVQPSQGSCSNSFGRTVCSFGNLNAGASASATITIEPLFGGYYTNRATVSSANADYAPWNNTSEEFTEVGIIDLGIRLGMEPGTLRAGVPFILTVQLTNAGPAMARDVYASFFAPSIAISPYSVYVTNFEAGASQNIPVTVVPLSSGYFWISARVSSFYQPDFNPTDNSFAFEGYVETGPGVLTLEPDAYAIQENGHAIVRVLRTGGSEGTLSASYVTSNGTAIANSDYVPVSGELVFAAGQTEANIIVPAVPDQASECNEFFSVHLFSTGPGTIVGPRSNALVSIAERPPPLAGYVRPVTVSAANPRLLVGSQSFSIGISADGRKVVFASSAPGLVEPPATFGSRRARPFNLRRA